MVCAINFRVSLFTLSSEALGAGLLAFVVTAKIGLKPNRRIEFYTSKIDCRLLEYELYSGTKRVDK